MEQDGVVPQAILSKPSLPVELLPYYNAFSLLNRLRGGNMAGEQPLRMSEMAAYLSIVNEPSVELRLKFIRLLAEMDGVYLQYRNEQRAIKS